MARVHREAKVINDCQPSCISDIIRNLSEPVILRGVVSDWPIVEAGLRSPDDVSDYLCSFYEGRPVTYYYGDPSIKGRVFYNEDFTGFNFQRSEAKLDSVLRLLKEHRNSETPPMFYVGSTLVDEWLPKFRRHNDLVGIEDNPLVSVWLGNRSSIAPHFDCPDNIACNVVGARTFTLFPPEQLENLYVGPLDITPSGRPISMVDVAAPDLAKYPKFRHALDAAQVAHLEPGDAIFIPSMWWHHVEAKADLNVLVNYWWRRAPSYMPNPESALHLALLCIRDLPKEDREIWRHFFNYYVFDDPDNSVAHIPQQIRGILSASDELIGQKIRAHLINVLKR